jgi:hypothetical protein
MSSGKLMLYFVPNKMYYLVFTVLENLFSGLKNIRKPMFHIIWVY